MTRRRFLWNGLLFVPMAARAQMGLRSPSFASQLSQKVASGTTYLINQGFEGSGYDNGETWTESGTGTINEDYTGVTMDGAQTLRIALAAQTGRTVSPTFAATKPCYVYFKWRAVAFPSSGSTVIACIYSGSTRLTQVSVSSAGVFTVRNGSTGGTTTGSVSTGTTYHIWITYTVGGTDGTSNLGYSTDGVKPTGYTHSGGDATASADNLCIGQITGSSSATCEFIYDHVLVNNASIGDNP